MKTAQIAARKRLAARGMSRPMFLATAVAVCAFSAWFGVQFSFPFVQARQLANANDRLERNMLRIVQANERASDQIKRWRTRDGQILLGRRNDWVMPGEAPLKLRPR